MATAKVAGRVTTVAEWVARGTELFGGDMLEWKFVCPACGHVQAVKDFLPFKDRGASPDSARFNCVGRYAGAARIAFGGSGDGPCDYTSGGLFNISPLLITDESGKEHVAFDFAAPNGAPAWQVK